MTMTKKICSECYGTFEKTELTECLYCFWNSDYCVTCINDHTHSEYECQCFDDNDYWTEDEDCPTCEE